MLAQNFKSAADLEITDAEHRSLVLVMGMFERGEIPAIQFHMASVESWCGSRACIMGWCQRVSGDDVFDSPIGFKHSPLYHGLFMFGDGRRYHTSSTQQAATALRSYLTTGDARWDLAVGEASGLHPDR